MLFLFSFGQSFFNGPSRRTREFIYIGQLTRAPADSTARMKNTTERKRTRAQLPGINVSADRNELIFHRASKAPGVATRKTRRRGGSTLARSLCKQSRNGARNRRGHQPAWRESASRAERRADEDEDEDEVPRSLKRKQERRPPPLPSPLTGDTRIGRNNYGGCERARARYHRCVQLRAAVRSRVYALGRAAQSRPRRRLPKAGCCNDAHGRGDG